MNLKEFDWSKVYINNSKDSNPFNTVCPSFLDSSDEKAYNDMLIRSYTEAEKKYVQSCSKVFGSANHVYEFKRDEDIVWVCSHCGYIHNNSNAPKACPICGSARAYFGLQY